MRRYLVGTPSGGVTSPLIYVELQIVDGKNPDDAREHYNRINSDSTKELFGTVIGVIKEDHTTKYIRNGKIDQKKMVYLFDKGTLLPVRDE